MNLKNFKLKKEKEQQIIEIESQGQLYDLHNAAEFINVEFNIKTCTSILHWNYYLDEKKIIPFKIVFSDVSHFEVSPRDPEMPIEEDDCLEQIIYDDKFKFKFMGGMKIIIRATEAYLE